MTWKSRAAVAWWWVKWTAFRIWWWRDLEGLKLIEPVAYRSALVKREANGVLMVVHFRTSLDRLRGEHP